MKNINNRTSCIICGCSNLKELILLKKMPFFMGANEGIEEQYSDMTFTYCTECSNVQIKELINPNILYSHNHNIDITGKLWKEHYIELISFIGDATKDKTVLEIGDPSCKISKHMSDESTNWYIAEPTPDVNTPRLNKVKFIKTFFDETFKINDKIDVIIHSHLLEHITNPIKHLLQVNELLEDKGKLIFSVPNISEILKTGQSPNAVLHFEHTYFFSKRSMELILRHCGFNIIKVFEYSNHSLFFMCEKDEKDVKEVLNISDINLANAYIISLFTKSLKNFKNKVMDINKTILNSDSDTIYLYGCHISSQFLINIGLDVSRIRFILDNSVSKVGWPLYGTGILTVQPEMITNDKKPLVILSHTSVYFDEIKQQLLELNKNVIIL